MMPAPAHRRGGFTLVELLLATALLSILLGLAYSGLRSSIRAADRGQDILQQSSRLRMAHQFVHRQLNQMLPLGFAQSETDDSFTVFQGSQSSIRFVAPMPQFQLTGAGANCTIPPREAHVSHDASSPPDFPIQ